MINEKWAVWIAKSVFVFLDAQIRAVYPDVQITIESQPELPTNNDQERIELRMDGPYYGVMPNGEWRARIEINCLVTSQAIDRDLYYHRALRGAVEKALSQSICLYKYGDGDALFGVVSLGRVVATYLGKIEVDSIIEQSVVEVAGTADLRGE